jgi:hypothetical protein
MTKIYIFYKSCGEQDFTVAPSDRITLRITATITGRRMLQFNMGSRTLWDLVLLTFIKFQFFSEVK